MLAEAFENAYTRKYSASFSVLSELNEKLLTVSKASVLNARAQLLRSWVLGLAAVVITILIFAAWYAGRQSASIETELLSAELNRLTHQIASLNVQLENERTKREEAETALKSAGRSAMVEQQLRLRQQILQARAEANQYKAIIDREERSAASDLQFLTALSGPGAHLLALTGSGPAAHTVAYALVVDNSKIFLIASKLPRPADGKQFEFWVLRNHDPKVVNGGPFTPDDNNQAIVDFEDPSAASDISLLEVTDEPRGISSSEPTGSKLLWATPESSPPTRGGVKP